VLGAGVGAGVAGAGVEDFGAGAGAALLHGFTAISPPTALYVPLLFRLALCQCPFPCCPYNTPLHVKILADFNLPEVAETLPAGTKTSTQNTNTQNIPLKNFRNIPILYY
jgi:hypothetical protein